MKRAAHSASPAAAGSQGRMLEGLPKATAAISSAAAPAWSARSGLTTRAEALLSKPFTTVSEVNAAPHAEGKPNRSWMVASYSDRDKRRSRRPPRAGPSHDAVVAPSHLPRVTRSTNAESAAYSWLPTGTRSPPVWPSGWRPVGRRSNTEVPSRAVRATARAASKLTASASSVPAGSRTSFVSEARPPSAWQTMHS
jgi:hypothetical protein